MRFVSGKALLVYRLGAWYSRANETMREREGGRESREHVDPDRS